MAAYRCDRERPCDWDVSIGPPPSVRYLDAWIARTRRVLGKPTLPALGALPDDVRRFVERMD
jgi:hypothetical protein